MENSQIKKVQVPGTNRVYYVHLDKMLGKGAFANVYRGARADSPNNLNFAVKRITKKLLDQYGAKGLRNLKNEFGILQRVKH